MKGYILFVSGFSILNYVANYAIYNYPKKKHVMSYQYKYLAPLCTEGCPYTCSHIHPMCSYKCNRHIDKRDVPCIH